MIEHAYQSNSAGHATQRIKRERIVARPGSASLMPKKLVPEFRSVTEVRDSAARYQRRAEDRQRHSRILALGRGAARGNQVHAHLTIGTDAGERATLTDVPAFDDPYLASGRADVGSQLIGYQSQRVAQIRSTAHLFKNLSYSIFPECRH